MDLKVMIGMENLVMIDKETFFKYPTDYKIVPNTDTIVLDIKSEAEFETTLVGPPLTPSSKQFDCAQASTFLHGFFPRSTHTLNTRLKPSSKPY